MLHLLAAVEKEIGQTPYAVIGHSFGAHLARGLAARQPDRVLGLALLCPLVPGAMEPAELVAVEDDGSAQAQLDPALLEEFLGYFAVRTVTTVARFQKSVVPALGRFNPATVEQLMSASDLDPEPAHVAFRRPVLLMGGRLDSVVGFRQVAALAEEYTYATSAILADAGHALPHERPELVASLLHQWLDRLN